MSLTHEEFACNYAFITYRASVYNGLIFVENFLVHVHLDPGYN